jgi:hypothetical protein
MNGAKETAKLHQVFPVALGQASLHQGRLSAIDDRAICEQETNPVRRIGSQLIECIAAQLALSHPLTHHVHKTRIVALESDSYGRRRAVAVLGHDQVRLAGPR